MTYARTIPAPEHVTRDECEAAMPHILAAPKDDAALSSLCFRPGPSLRSFPDSLQVSVARGIEGERWLDDPWLRLADGRPDPRIQICILPLRVMDLCWRDRVNSVHPGDTMVADLDMSEANLPVGTRLQIGSCVVEVSDMFNTACAKWQARYGGDSLSWINHRPYRPLRLRGVLCRVVEDGEIHATSRIRKLTPGSDA